MALESECVLYLRAGEVIRAQVLEYVPGSHVMLRAFDGQTFRLAIDQVLEIRHPGDGPLPPSPACVRIPRALRNPPPAPVEEPAARLVQPTPPPVPAPDVALSGPPVHLETDVAGVELQVSTGVKKNLSYRRGREVINWEYEWKTLCTAPCGQPIGEEGIYRVGGPEFRPSAPFRLDGLSQGPFNLKLRMGPTHTYRGGVASALLGVLSGLTGVGLLIAGATMTPVSAIAGAPPSYAVDYQNGLAAQRTFLTAGGVLLGTGIVGTIAGALLLRRGKSMVTIERPSEPVEPDPASPGEPAQ